MGVKKNQNNKEIKKNVHQRKAISKSVEDKSKDASLDPEKNDQVNNKKIILPGAEAAKDAISLKPKKEIEFKENKKKRKAATQKTPKRKRREDNRRKKNSSNSAFNYISYAIRLWCRRHYIIVVCSISSALLLGALYMASDTLDKQEAKRIKQPDITDKVAMKISIEDGETDNIVIGLYGKDCPLTVKNFISLATHAKGYGYNGSRFFMSFPDTLIMGGDIEHNNGTGGRSGIDEPFEEENVKIRHTVPGNIGMMGLKANKDSKKSSQFYISFSVKAAMYDGLTTVFGRVIQGLEFLSHISKVSIDKDMRLKKQITIISSTHEKLKYPI